MSKKIVALSLLLVLTAICITSVSTVKAQTNSIGTGQWITQYTIVDASTGVNLLTKNFAAGTTSGSGEIYENEELEVTATINIATNDPTANLFLSTNMLHSLLQSNMYWSLPAGSSYSLGTSNPNSYSVQVSETAGTLVISCYGLTPTDVVKQSAPGGITLNIPYPISLITLADPTGTVLDQIKPSLINANIYDYLTLLSQREASLKSYQSSGVASGFTAIYANVINASETLNNQGFTDGAISMLNGLNVSAPPKAPTASSQEFYIPVAVVLAAVAVVFAFMFMRVRGRISYFQLVVEDQIKDLEGLSMRASRIDRTMSSSLEQVKDSLKRLVGM